MRIEHLTIPEEFAQEFDLAYKMDIASLFEWFSGILSSKQTKKIERALHNLGQELLEIEL